TRSLFAKRIWNWCFKAEHRDRARGRQDQLRHRTAWCRRYCEDALFACSAAECRDQACDKTVKIFRSHVDMRGVELRSNSHACCFECLPILGKSTDRRRSSSDAERQKYRNEHSRESSIDSHSFPS